MTNCQPQKVNAASLSEIRRCLTGSLHDVIGRGEQGGAAESEDDGVGMQWAQTSELQPRQVEIQRRPRQLSSYKDPHQHADDAPDHRHYGELAYHFVVVSGVFQRRIKLTHGLFPIKNRNSVVPRTRRALVSKGRSRAVIPEDDRADHQANQDD